MPLSLLAGITFVVLFALFVSTGCGGSGSSAQPEDPLTDAEWIGFRDGDGAWQDLELPESGVLVFDDDTTGTRVTDAQGRYTLVSMRAFGASQRVMLVTLQSTVSESTQLDFSDFMATGEQAFLDVTVSGLGVNEVADLYLADEDNSRSSDGLVSFYDNAGTYDLVATRSSDSQTHLPSDMVIRHDLTLSSGTTSNETIDFVAPGLITLSGPNQITVNNAENALGDGEVFLLTKNYTAARLGYTPYSGSTPISDIDFMALPTEKLSTGDLYMVRVSLDLDDDSFITYFEGFGTAGNMTIDPPGLFDGELLSDTSTGFLLLGLSATAYGDAIGYTTEYTGTGNGIEYGVTCHVSSGWFDGTSVEFLMPDMRTAPGWQTNWSIPTTAELDWAYVSAQAGSTGSNLQDFADWYISRTPHVAADQWFASSVNSYAGDGQELFQ